MPSRHIHYAKHQSHEGFWWACCGLAATIATISLIGTFPVSDPHKKQLTPSLALQKPPFSTLQGANDAKPLAKLAPSTVLPSPPIELIIPAIGLYSSVGELGLQRNGQVMVPSSSHTIGWYTGGVTPGEVGSAVILGHVDSYLGPGTFFNLKSLQQRDAIDVVLADGIIEKFLVTKVEQYSKAFFPDELVYGSTGVRGLQLVTCGGTFNHSTGSYESNIVVFSVLTG